MPNEQSNPPNASFSSDLDSNAANPLVTFSKSAMACTFEIIAPADNQQRLAQSIVGGFDLIDDLERQMTVYAEHSDVIAINRLAPNREVPVESELFELLQTAKRISQWTGGAFDITTTRLSRIWGFHRRAGQLPERDEIESALACTGHEYLQLDDGSQTARFLNPELEIDLGGIGKGHALDRLSALLQSDGNQQFVIHGGQSSVVARGDYSKCEDGQPLGWLVGISHPMRANERIATIRLTNRALGTSGSARQSFVHRGNRYGHVIDPRTGWPTDKLLSATVLAPTAAEADALATAVLVDGAHLAEQICSQGSPYSAILVEEGRGSGEVVLRTINIDDNLFEIGTVQ